VCPSAPVIVVAPTCFATLSGLYTRWHAAFTFWNSPTSHLSADAPAHMRIVLRTPICLPQLLLLRRLLDMFCLDLFGGTEGGTNNPITPRYGRVHRTGNEQRLRALGNRSERPCESPLRGATCCTYGASHLATEPPRRGQYRLGRAHSSVIGGWRQVVIDAQPAHGDP
jgi:hypothetical protein